MLKPLAMRPALFLPRRYLQKQQEIISPLPGRKGRREWVIARSLCHYRLFDLTELPLARREEALRLKIRQWSPFSEYGHYIVWRKAYAQAWIWEQPRLQQAQKSLNLSPIPPMPESVLRPFLTDGLSLFQAAEGIEAQIWREGVLQGSRWWRETPSIQEWRYFLRHHGVTGSETLPTAQELPLLPQPWGKPRAAFASHLRQERIWVTFGAAILCGILAWQSVLLWKTQDALTQLRSRVEQLTSQANPLLTAKSQAMENQEKILKLLQLNPYPPPLTVFARLSEQLPPQNAQLVDWFYQNGELRFTLQAPRIDLKLYVESLQNYPLFREVSAETGRADNQMTFKLRLNVK